MLRLLTRFTTQNFDVDADHISLSAGWTKSDVEFAPNELIFKKILGQPSNINKLVYYNVDQQHILANKLTLVVLKGDFGAGIIFCIDFNLMHCGNRKLRCIGD